MDELLPRPNNLPPISIRKSAFGRTNLFMESNSMMFKEVKCAASTMARQATASVYNMHDTNNIESDDKKVNTENIVCWHCCHSFEGQGFRLPRSYDPAEKMYHVYGWFCSANCCKAYILEHSTFDRGYQMNVFVRMLREVYNIDNGIIEAPPRIALKMFGGSFDIETFRKQKNVCYVVHPPFVSYCMLIEERQPIQSIGEKSSTSSLNNIRGTVKGLRRPTSGSVTVTEDEFSTPNEDGGLYSKFLSTREVTMEDTEVYPPSEKRQKREVKKNLVNEERGLGRFMSNPNK
jgi:hypothetical protein